MNVNWVESGRAQGERVCRERERELRQRHVGDVVWLPQAEEGGGVFGRWKSAEKVRERETKAGAEEARRKAWIKKGERQKGEEEKKKTTCTGQQQSNSKQLKRRRREKKSQQESRLLLNLWNESRPVEK